MTALDQYQNVDTNFTGAQCVTFSGPDNAPNGANPSYPAPGGACATGSSAVTFDNGFVDGLNILSVTLFDAETADLTATFLRTQTGSQAITVNAAPAVTGIGITGITQNTTRTVVHRGGGLHHLHLNRRVPHGRQCPHGIDPTRGPVRKCDRKCLCEPLDDRYEASGNGNVSPGGTGALTVLSGIDPVEHVHAESNPGSGSNGRDDSHSGETRPQPRPDGHAG